MRELVLRSIDDAEWILKNTHGTGDSAARGYGASVPATSLSLHTSEPKAPECTAPVALGQTCNWKSSASQNFKLCTSLACDGVKQLTAKAWVEPLPVSVPTIMGCCEPVGTTVIQAFVHQVKFLETSPDTVQVGWTGTAGLVLDNVAGERSSTGAATLSGGVFTTATISDEILSIAPEPIHVEVAMLPSVKGTIKHGAVQLGVVSGKSVEWIDVCN